MTWRGLTITLLALLIFSPLLMSNAYALDYVNAAVNCSAANPAARGGFFPITIFEQSCGSIEDRQETYGAVFSLIVCNFINIVNVVLVQIYCGMQPALMPIVMGAITLYVVLFGAQLLIGSAQLNGGEVAKHLLKIGAVWLFVDSGAWAVTMIYNFFIGLSVEGIGWVIKIVSYCNPGADGTGGMCYAAPNTSNIFKFIDRQLYGAIESIFFGEGRTPLVAFFLILSAIQPATFMMALSLMMMTLMIFVRSLMSFLMGIAAVAFLIALSPIFLCFMLFKSTTQFFESWMRYIISYSLQPIITFACLALWMGITLQFVGFMSDLSSVLVSYRSLQTTGVVANPVDSVGMCPLTYEDTDIGPRIRCRDGDASSIPVEQLIAPSKIIEEKQFMHFLAYHLFTLMVVAYAFSALLKSAPDISRQLAGPMSVVPLGANTGGVTDMGHSFSGLAQLTKQIPSSAAGSGAAKGFMKKFGEMLGQRK